VSGDDRRRIDSILGAINLSGEMKPMQERTITNRSSLQTQLADSSMVEAAKRQWAQMRRSISLG
jgi:hypothetical protein